MNSKGSSGQQGTTNWQGPGVAGNVSWEQATLAASQPNQFRDGQ